MKSASEYSRMRKIIENPKSPFVFFGFIFLLAMSRVVLMTYSDDAMYSTVLKKTADAFRVIKEYYLTWNGRVAINTAMIFVMRENIWLWRILNTIAFTLLIFASYRVIALDVVKNNFKKRWIIIFFIFCMFFLSNLRAVKWGAFWVTGSFNYLWPLSFMVFSLFLAFRLIDGKDTPVKYSLAYIPFVVYSSCQEQAGLVLSFFLLFSLLYYYIIFRKISPCVLIIFIISSAILLVVVFAPATKVRFISEIGTWYPQFEFMSLGDKIIQGFAYTVLYGFFVKSFVLSFCLYTLTAYLIFKKGSGLVIKILSIIPIIYLIVCILYKLISPDLFYSSLFFNFYMISEKFIKNISNISYYSMILGIFMILILPFLFYKLFGFGSDFWKCFLLYGGGLSSSFILSFSPTVFGSGERIFLIGNFLLVILGANLLIKSIESMKLRILE